MEIKSIIFDFDMTLSNTLAAGNRALRDLEIIHGLDLSALTERDAWDLPHFELAKKISGLNGGRMHWEEISRQTIKSMKKYYAECELEGISGLKIIMDKGVKFGIVSNNSTEAINLVLEKENNKNILFEIVYGADNRPKETSKSDLIKLCLDKFGYDENEALYVGDHPKDIVAGKKSGVKTVAVVTGLHNKEELDEYNPDYIIKSLEELPLILF